MKKYLVEETQNDIFRTYYDTLDEANDAASYKWYRLTPGEKKKTTIKVGWVTPEMVDEDLRYDEEDDWWEACADWDADDQCISFGVM